MWDAETETETVSSGPDL